MNRKSNLWLDRRRLSSSKFYYNISWCISGWSWRRVQKSDRPPRRNQRWGIPWSWSCCEKRRTIFKACWRKRRWFWHTWEENCMGNGHSKVSLHTSWGLSSIPWYVSLLILQTLYVSLISMYKYCLFHIANTRDYWGIFLFVSHLIPWFDKQTFTSWLSWEKDFCRIEWNGIQCKTLTTILSNSFWLMILCFSLSYH